MVRIQKKTNTTRDLQRPPLVSPAVPAALLAYLGRNAPAKKSKHPARRSDRPKTQEPPKSQQVPLPPANPAPASKPAAGSPAQQQPLASSAHPFGTNGSKPVSGASGTKAPNGMNGTNGHAARSSIFQPGAFPSISPSNRLPNKPASPVQTHWQSGNRWPKPAPQGGLSTDKGSAGDEQPENKTPQNRPPVPPAPEAAKPAVPQPAPAARPPEQPSRPAPRLAEYLKQHPELPSETALLGICEDHLPVLLDLHDPAPGAVLAMGDEREKMIDLLRTAVASMASRNSPRSVQFLVLTRDTQSWQQWIKLKGFERHSLGVESTEGELVREWVLQLADWTEQRRLGQRSGPPVLMIMDTLSFLQNLAYDVRLNFDWLLKEGPQARIWPLATISTELAKVLQGRRMLRAFQTRILGSAADPADYIQLAGLREQDAAGFGGTGQFAVQLGEDWLRFRLFETR